MITMEPSQPSFHHPYEPYDIQLEFMQNLYNCIENGNVGIFESPTGTGKSLSLICAALTWLRDNENRQYRRLFPEDASASDWLARAEVNNRRQELLQDRAELEKKLQKVRDRETRVNHDKFNRPLKKVRGDERVREVDYVLEEYDSDEEAHNSTNLGDHLSSATRSLLEKLQPSNSVVEDEQRQERIKVIFCSRTHSQLLQFVSELKRIDLPSGLPLPDNTEAPEVVKHVSLGSRKNLCINPKVRQLSSSIAINEQCLDLQKPEASKDNRCEFLPSHASKEDSQRLETFKQNVIADIRDIEDIGQLGKHMNLCPYYAARSVIPDTEIVTLPYPLLLQKAARDALGMSVKDNVIIIDEAHNLIDAIAGIHSITLKLTHLVLAKSQVTGYCQRFKNRLKGKNRVYLTQIIKLLTSCINRIENETKQPGQQIPVVANDFLAAAGLDQVQPYKLLKYLHESKLVYKVEGYTELVAESEQSSSSKTVLNRTGQPKGILAEFQDFLFALTNPASEGRFYIAYEDDDPVIKYTLLDPREHFRDIVQEARSVILAGGTMSPMSDYCDRLFSYLKPQRIKTYSFKHVVAKTSLLVEPVVKGPNGIEMDFTWASRRSTETIVELGNMIERMCAETPDGTVVFFPSYEYLAFVLSIWKRLPEEQPLWKRMFALKPIFEESKSTTVDELLNDYAKSIQLGDGALMLSVVGGKLSEGINFSDKLGRVVICVGLPFPNIHSAEWKAKVKYIEEIELEKQKSLGRPKGICTAKSHAAGRDFTDNTTMRAVNQSIGRAIRHRKDFAAILLIDKRFATARIQSKLPGWIRSSLQTTTKEWVDIENSCVDFFGKQAQAG